MAKPRTPVVLIAGPTASGKSALALEMAAERDAVIVNADSMQVYDQLRILTARPAPEDEAHIPHRLYGHIPPSVAHSVSRWLADAEREIRRAGRDHQPVIIVGGTGLYFKGLEFGLSPIPEIPAEIRSLWRQRAREAPGHIHEVLRERDPVMASRLAPSDAQRIVRALEVIDATGRSLADWQAEPGRPLVDPSQCTRIYVTRPRAELHARCDLRFESMLEEGALQEVSALMALQLDPALPAMRAIGVAPVAAYLDGRITRDEAATRGKAETRQYVKRQETWARKHMMTWRHLSL